MLYVRFSRCNDFKASTCSLIGVEIDKWSQRALLQNLIGWWNDWKPPQFVINVNLVVTSFYYYSIIRGDTMDVLVLQYDNVLNYLCMLGHFVFVPAPTREMFQFYPPKALSVYKVPNLFPSPHSFSQKGWIVSRHHRSQSYTHSQPSSFIVLIN